MASTLAGKVAVGAALGFAAWIVLLLIAGWAGEGWARERVQARLASSMGGRATVGAVDLGLVRGRIAVDDVRFDRTGPGRLRVEVRRAEADVAPLGLAALRDTAGDVVVRGVRIEVSALALLAQRGAKGEPVQFDSLRLEDVRLSLDALSLVPGLAGVDVEVVRAEVGPTTLRTPLSWLFALRTLNARLRLPAGIELELAYADGVLRVAGALLGSAPVELPFALPALEIARETEQLAELGKRVAAELARQVGGRWLDRFSL